MTYERIWYSDKHSQIGIQQIFQNHGSHPLKASAQRPTLASENGLPPELAGG